MTASRAQLVPFHLFLYISSNLSSNVHHQYLIWLEESWFAGNVKNVDEAGCFKAENEDSLENYAEKSLREYSGLIE